jgi:NAD(P)-dependent dehydrogenase (short-subunit alcohol dehydrogenase family)
MNQVALISGGGGGIGGAVARRMARATVTVVVADYDLDAAEKVCGEIVRGGGKAEAMSVDVTQARGVKALVTDVTQRLGRIDVLANIAGGSFYTKRIEEFIGRNGDKSSTLISRARSSCAARWRRSCKSKNAVAS